ncbi:putative oxidoreductase [Paraliobacillus quinghaiensis]|uniref:Oxidoreductase n=1 Tax=Paraliobacillus quinghaiensis TaxID=470815 RepID=A0A917TV64_9BACI|nr:glucose 1-dehydrogenase [Paraliobacillus quinghaiensis]GGM39917.1 putative oxidoreductase [Paraliobacillus quinghaiensis]
MTFTEKVVIVTGGANGIGQAIVKVYAKEGARVVIADIDKKAGEEVLRLTREEGAETIFIETDVRDPNSIEQLMKRTVETFGVIDILINNAGVSRFKSFFDLSVTEWDDIINTNLRGVFLCAQEAAKIMRGNGGAIVNLASTRAFMSEPNTESYSASKGGIYALTHSLALTLQEENITVNAISPGWIATENYEALRQIDHTQHPSKRVGKPEDIARACLFLTNPLNDFITGENIVIDGGMTRKMMYEH